MGCLSGVVCALLAAGLLAAADWPQVRLVRAVSGLDLPTHVTSAGDGSGRLFVVEQRGRIRVVRDGALQPAPFLDIANRVSCCNERGLLNVTFPPGFAARRYFYVNYTNLQGNTVVGRYRLTANDDAADPNSETVILTVQQPFANHNGGQMAFGPRDGFLYIGLGDGGDAGDPQGNGQNRNALLGKILRLDVESGVAPYAVPPNQSLCRHRRRAPGGLGFRPAQPLALLLRPFHRRPLHCRRRPEPV